MDSPPSRSSTKEMGDKFSKTYYFHLQNHPENLSKFYKEQSTISRPGLDGENRTSTLLNMIDRLDMLSSGGFDWAVVTKVTSKDSQEDEVIGIHVHVNGYLSLKEKPTEKNFTQTFFLAPQANGFFVLTDIFSFVKDNAAKKTSYFACEEEDDSVTFGSILLPVVAKGGAICVKNLPQDSTIAFVEAAFKHFGEIRRGGIEVRNTKGFSYGFVEFKEASAAEKAIEASPLMLAGGNVYVENKRPDYISYWETPSYGPGTKSRSEAMTGGIDDKLGNLLKPLGELKVHVGNLPPHPTFEWVEHVFKEFGPITRKGTEFKKCRNTENYWYGYVMFEKADSVKRAIQASPIWIGDRKLKVQKPNRQFM